MTKSFSIWSWRVSLIILSLPAFAFAVWVSTYWEYGTAAKAGTLAATFSVPDTQLRNTILAMDADSPLARAGARVGDVVSPDHKIDWGNHQLGTDEVIGLTLFSGGQSVHLSLQPIPHKEILAHASAAEIGVSLTIASGFLGIIIAVLVGWQRGDSPAMRLFSVLLLIPIGVDVFRQLMPIGAVGDFYAQAMNPLQFFGGYALFVLFSLIYPEDQPLWRHAWVRRVFYVYFSCFAASTACRLAIQSGVFPGSLNSLITGAFLAKFGEIMACVSVVASLLPLAYSWSRATGVTRQRLGWIGVCMGSIYATWFLVNLVAAMGWDVSNLTIEIVMMAVALLALAGFAYALLRHRLLDFGFAINRALVFTIISTLLLVLFSITEFAVDKLLHFEGRQKNVVFDALVALAVILSFHRIQHWISHRVDHTFFHHWYEAAEKLRHFLDKAVYVSQIPVLQEKFMRAILEYCDAQGAAFYTLDSSGNHVLQMSTLDLAPEVIDANDNVVIDLKHNGEFVDLRDAEHALTGELAFPMVLRGRLNGIVLLGARVGGNQFRPDQITLLKTAIHRFGLDLESLRVEAMERRAGESEQMAKSLERELEVLRHNVSDLRANNERLLTIVDDAKLSRVA